MPVYGYQRAVVDARYDLLELREVSFQFGPADLRRIAAFLSHYANEMERGTWPSSHAHIATFDPAWSRDRSAPDLVVINPSPTPPRETG
jgi:hypothetical protein